jgi:hypothetical protein
MGMIEEKRVNVCGVPYMMTIVDGGVLFSNKSGFYGVSGRFMFEYRGHLWYLMHSESTFGEVPVCHLARMAELLAKYIGSDHTEADGSVFTLQFKANQ